MRDELTSGRLADYLRRIGRIDLVPRVNPNRSADDQLDDWLARLPASRSSAPEIDVHPETVLIRATAPGGIVQQTLRITNVGYRLLRSTARVEPSGTLWLRLALEFDGRPFLTIDQTDLPIEVEFPETIDGPLVAQVVIDSNGGSRSIAVRVERPAGSFELPEHPRSAAGETVIARAALGQSLAHIPPGVRIAACCAGAAALRIVAAFMNRLLTGKDPVSGIEPRLASIAIILVAVGVLCGLAAVAGRRREWWDFPAIAFAAGSAGLLVASVWCALLQSVEHLFAFLSSGSLVLAGLVSCALGAVLAVCSSFLFPYRSSEPEATP